MVRLKLPGCPWALSTVLMSCLLWEQHIHHRTARVDSNIDLIFQHSTYETWLQCRKKKNIYCCYISLVYHWSTEAGKHFWILCQDNKIAINITLPTACMLETGKRAKLEIHNAFLGKEILHLERPTAHVLVASSSQSGELLSAPLPPSWQKMTLLRASCLSGRQAKLQILNSATLREHTIFSKKLGTFT